MFLYSVHSGIDSCQMWKNCLSGSFWYWFKSCTWIFVWIIMRGGKHLMLGKFWCHRFWFLNFLKLNKWVQILTQPSHILYDNSLIKLNEKQEE